MILLKTAIDVSNDVLGKKSYTLPNGIALIAKWNESEF